LGGESSGRLQAVKRLGSLGAGQYAVHKRRVAHLDAGCRSDAGRWHLRQKRRSGTKGLGLRQPRTYASAFVLARAEAITSRMFATAGIALEWHSAAPAVCQKLQQTKTVILDFASNTPPGEHPGAMAYAQPYEAVHIVVLYDLIENSADGAT